MVQLCTSKLTTSQSDDASTLGAIVHQTQQQAPIYVCAYIFIKHISDEAEHTSSLTFALLYFIYVDILSLVTLAKTDYPA